MTFANTEIVRRWIQGLNDDALQTTLDISDEVIEIGNVERFVVQGRYSGHGGVRKWLDDAFDVLTDRRFEVDEPIEADDGETVVTVQRALGVSSHTGLPFDLEWAATWKVRGGKVAEIQGYATKAEALEAAGIG